MNVGCHLLTLFGDQGIRTDNSAHTIGIVIRISVASSTFSQFPNLRNSSVDEIVRKTVAVC